MKKKFLLRIDPNLWDEINRWADQELRSVNAQMEYILKEAVAKRGKRVELEAETEADGPPPKGPND